MAIITEDDDGIVELTFDCDTESPGNPETFGEVLSAFVNEQVPQFVRQQYPDFVIYLEEFNKFLELPCNPVGRITDFPDYIDVDWTTDEFFPLFKATYLAPFPETFMADRALVTKRIKDFYAAKGTEESFRVLFRILFGEEIIICLPKESILKASDGTWQRDIKIFVQAKTLDPIDFARTSIQGVTSGAIAEVEEVDSFQAGSFTVFSLLLRSFKGTFEPNETIFADQCPQLTACILGVVQDVDIIEGCDDYELGDVVTIQHATGVNAAAEVCEVDSTNPIESFIINDGGIDFRVGDPVDFSVNGGFGAGAIAEVSEIFVLSSIMQGTKTISEEQNTLLSSVAAIVIEDFINIELIERGRITEIEILDEGKFYPNNPFQVNVGSQAPAPCIGWPEGSGENIFAVTGTSGCITDVCMLDEGVGYDDTATADIITGNGQAILVPVVDGGPVDKGGFYRTTDSFLSSDKVLQDNVYFQNYSYDITSEHSINEWRDTVKAAAHPAGYALFGTLNIFNEEKLVFRINEFPIDKRIVVETDIQMVILDDDEDLAIFVESFVGCHDFDPFPYLIRDYGETEIACFADTPIIDFVRTDSDPCYQQNLILYDLDKP